MILVWNWPGVPSVLHCGSLILAKGPCFCIAASVLPCGSLISAKVPCLAPNSLLPPAKQAPKYLWEAWQPCCNCKCCKGYVFWAKLPKVWFCKTSVLHCGILKLAKDFGVAPKTFSHWLQVQIVLEYLLTIWHRCKWCKVIAWLDQVAQALHVHSCQCSALW